VLDNVLIPCFARRDGSFKLHALSTVGDDRAMVDKAEAILRDVEMAEKRHMHAGSLSRGDKRRLELAMCLVQEPRLLLLDEPTAGMARADTNNTIDLLKRIKASRPITMVIIEHDMHVVFSLAERITVMAQGAPLVEDEPARIKGHPKVQEAYLGESRA
jgi:branched-chain amino acid transport system ATP-binding protein